MRLCCLASGSKGNCTFIESNKVKILIDCGLSLKQLKERLETINIDIKDINYIIITHEHSDHIKGLDQLLKNYNIKVYINSSLYSYFEIKEAKYLNKFIVYNNNFVVEDILINPICLSHDSISCNGYTFICNSRKICYLTDLGCFNQSIIDNIKNCSLAIIEANHDEKMLLKNPNYSLLLKRRILSNKGHLSNSTSACLIKELVLSGTKQVILAHLSEENNTPSLAFNTVKNYLESFGIKESINYKIDIAFQNKVGNIYKLKDNDN